MEPLTLYELNSLVRDTLELTFDAEYWVQAELSEVREAYNGHCYLELVQKALDGRDLVAKARGVVWSGTYRQLKPYFERETGRRLSAGMNVMVRVRVAFHELYGYSLTVTGIEPAYTLGDMARQRREILARLEADGILNDNKELTLPLSANRVAVISSATAAGYEDFRNQLLLNKFRFRFAVQLFPAAMQGERVEETVLAALDAIMAEQNRWDAVVIIRGGGATSDLSGFDTYLLAAACTQFPLPIITGIGHERDDTVLDLVAHTRVKTPTAAAEFLIQHQLEAATRLETAAHTATQSALARLERERSRTDRLSAALSAAAAQSCAKGQHRLEQTALRLSHAWQQRLSAERHAVDSLADRATRAIPMRLDRERMHLQLLAQRCEAADPGLLLKRGYSMTFCNGRLVRKASDAKKGETLTTRLAEGELRSVVE